MSTARQHSNGMLVAWLNRRRAAVLACAVVAFDAFVMGNAIGFGSTLSSWLDRPWCRVGYPDEYSPQDVFILSLACSQISLLTLWCWFSGRTRTLRGLTWLAGVGLWVTAIASQRNRGYGVWLDLGLLFLVQSAAIGVAAWVCICGGCELAQMQPAAASAAQPQGQFSLQELLACISILAVLSATASWFSWLDVYPLSGLRNQWFWFRSHPPSFLWIVAHGASCAGLGWAALWVSLTNQHLVRRALLVGSASIALGWLFVAAGNHYRIYRGWGSMSYSAPFAAHAVWFLVQVTFSSLLLLAVRASGYRLVARRTPNPGCAASAYPVLACGAALGVTCLGLVMWFFDDACLALQRYRQNARLGREAEAIGRVWGNPRGGFSLSLEGPLDADAVSLLWRHSNIQAVNLGPHTRPSSQIKQLAQLPPSVQSIYVHDREVSDDEFAYLAALHSLRELSFARTNVADHQLQHLRDLQGLLQVRFFNCKVTNQGAKQLQDWLPAAVIRNDR